MPGVPADAVIKIGLLVGGAKTGHVYCHRATEFSHAACQSAPIQNRPRIAVHENHRFIGICRSEFEQRRTYAVNDDRGPVHSSAIDLLSLSSGHARLGYAPSGSFQHTASHSCASPQFIRARFATVRTHAVLLHDGGHSAAILIGSISSCSASASAMIVDQSSSFA